LPKTLLLAVLLGSALAAQAAEPSPAHAASAASAAAANEAHHPLTGLWHWTMPGKACAETWHYHANNTRTSSSGAEITQSHYEVASKPNLLGFYRLTETVTESNGKRDCAGDLHEVVGEPVTRFIQFSPKLDQLIVCKEESLKACFGPFKRIPAPE